MQLWWEDPTAMAVVVAAAVPGLVALVLLILWLLARRRARVAQADRTAAERDRLDLEITLGEQAGRLRIIGELHEIAAASVSSLARQAATVRYSTADPEATARAVDQLAADARAALADLRRVSGLVRDGGGAGAAPAPEPELATLDELFGLLRESGLVVEVAQTGAPLTLREGAELAVYRILQQALDNSLVHGGPGTTARVTLRWTEDGLHVLVDDDGTRAAARRAGLDPDQAAQARVYSQEDDLAALTSTPRGRGLSEMRERAEMFGGVLTVQEVPGVGFSVSAILPALAHHNGVHGVKLGE